MNKLVEKDIQDLQHRIISYTFGHHYKEFTDLLDTYVLDVDMPKEAAYCSHFLLGIGLFLRFRSKMEKQPLLHSLKNILTA